MSLHVQEDTPYSFIVYDDDGATWCICTDKEDAETIAGIINQFSPLAALQLAVGKLVRAKGRFHAQISYEELAALYEMTKGKPVKAEKK